MIIGVFLLYFFTLLLKDVDICEVNIQKRWLANYTLASFNLPLTWAALMVLKLINLFPANCNFSFLFSFSDFEILKFLQNYIATFFLSPAWLWNYLTNEIKYFFLWTVLKTSVKMSVPWWPSWTQPSVYSIHSSSSDKKFVVICRLRMWVSLHFCEDHHQSGSNWFCLVSYETWSNTVTLSVHESLIYHRYQDLHDM